MPVIEPQRGALVHIEDLEWYKKCEDLFVREITAAGVAGRATLEKTLRLFAQDDRVAAAIQDFYHEDAKEAFEQEWLSRQKG